VRPLGTPIVRRRRRAVRAEWICVTSSNRLFPCASHRADVRSSACAVSRSRAASSQNTRGSGLKKVGGIGRDSARNCHDGVRYAIVLIGERCRTRGVRQHSRVIQQRTRRRRHGTDRGQQPFSLAFHPRSLYVAARVGAPRTVRACSPGTTARPRP